MHCDNNRSQVNGFVTLTVVASVVDTSVPAAQNWK
jgi:hypothetical protein